MTRPGRNRRTACSLAAWWEGPQQLGRLCQLYAALRLLTNIYQPSAKQIPCVESDARDGRRRRRHHDQPLTIRLEREGPGLYVGSLRTLKRRMADWRVTHAEQVMGQQMGAIQEQVHSQLNKRRNDRPDANESGNRKNESTRRSAQLAPRSAARCSARSGFGGRPI